jgi:hypothetical protein
MTARQDRARKRRRTDRKTEARYTRIVLGKRCKRYVLTMDGLITSEHMNRLKDEIAEYMAIGADPFKCIILEGGQKLERLP